VAVVFVDGTGTVPPVVAPAKKLGGAAPKPRPKEGKLWPTGLPKQAS
jgi:hypothetical protein